MELSELLRSTHGAREKNYLKHPDLLDIHVARLVEADRLVSTYMVDSDLLKIGIAKKNGFLKDRQLIEGVLKQIQESPVRSGRFRNYEVALNTGSPAFIAMEAMWPIVLSLFRDHMTKEVSQLFCQNTYLQRLLNSPDDGDEQKVFHSDTFFHCVKFWYFPQQVTEDDGAFWYVPYSPILTDGLIDWHEQRVEDLKKGAVEEWRGVAHKEGSFRISEAELNHLYLTPTAVEVEPDTLVIANVYGFHRRGDTKKPAERLSLHGSIRIIDPFAHG